MKADKDGDNLYKDNTIVISINENAGKYIEQIA